MKQETKHRPLLTHHTKGLIEAGADEAGRGCLCGPVVAAAVVLPEDFELELLHGINDSKKLTERKREILAPLIKQYATAWAVGIASASEIDEINILKASILAMHRAIEGVCTQAKVEHLLIDGNKFYQYKNIRHTCIVGGDGKFASIAAASIIAKTERDNIMRQLDAEFPGYGWAKNKGYPTAEHYEAIVQLGQTPYHRQSFKLTKEETLLDLMSETDSER